MKTKKIPFFLTGFLLISVSFAYFLDGVLGASYTKKAIEEKANTSASVNENVTEKKKEAAVEVDVEAKEGEEELKTEKNIPVVESPASVKTARSKSKSKSRSKSRSVSEEKEDQEKVKENQHTLADFVIHPNDLNKRLESYEKLYEKKRRRDRKKEEDAIIQDVNSNAYIGDGSRASRRLYLLEQAYRRAREAVPVPGVHVTDVGDDTLVRMLRKDQEFQNSHISVKN